MRNTLANVHHTHLEELDPNRLIKRMQNTGCDHSFACSRALVWCQTANSYICSFRSIDYSRDLVSYQVVEDRMLWKRWSDPSNRVGKWEEEDFAIDLHSPLPNTKHEPT